MSVEWAAGVFEGEGWFALSRTGGGAYPLAALSMVDEDVVRRFHDAVGVGRVIYEKPRGRSRQGAWRWKVCNRPDFETFATLVEPRLGERRSMQLAAIREGASPVKCRSGARAA